MDLGSNLEMLGWWVGGGLQAIRQRKALTFISDTQSPTDAWNNKISIVEQVNVTFQGVSNFVFGWSSMIFSKKFKVYKWVDFMQKIMRFLQLATHHSSRGWVGRWMPQRKIEREVVLFTSILCCAVENPWTLSLPPKQADYTIFSGNIRWKCAAWKNYFFCQRIQ